jgi:hypothetical protein
MMRPRRIPSTRCRSKRGPGVRESENVSRAENHDRGCGCSHTPVGDVEGRQVSACAATSHLPAGDPFSCAVEDFADCAPMPPTRESRHGPHGQAAPPAARTPLGCVTEGDASADGLHPRPHAEDSVSFDDGCLPLIISPALVHDLNFTASAPTHTTACVGTNPACRTTLASPSWSSR